MANMEVRKKKLLMQTSSQVKQDSQLEVKFACKMTKSEIIKNLGALDQPQVSKD
jgi:hypothetical protein